MVLASPEAHICNLLQGAHTSRRFGPRLPVGNTPDAFGHPGQIPQILRGVAIDKAAVWRGVVGPPAPTVNFEAVLSKQEPADLAAAQLAKRAFQAGGADPGVTYSQVQARTLRAARVHFLTPVIPAHGWDVT